MVTIFHASYENDVFEVICESFPKNLAIHFSGLFRDSLPPSNQAHVNRKGCDGDKTVTIVGGLKQAFSMIFKWMLNSCEGKGIARIELLAFAKYVRILEAAEILDTEAVRLEMWHRLSRIAA